MNPWYQQSLLELSHHTQDEVLLLLDLATTLKQAKHHRTETPYLTGKNVALLFEKTSTRTRAAFEVACFDQGARCSYLGPGATQLGDKESVADTARVLGRMYDAIEYRGFAQQTVDTLAQYANVPIYNGLTDQSHPTQMLADLLTMREFSANPLSDITFCYLGDARNNTAHSLLLTGALMGMNVRIAAPKALQPSPEVITRAQQLAAQSGATILVSEDVTNCVTDCDFIHTDIWVSMGEDAQAWADRMDLLMPYRVTKELMQATNNPQVRFMHCLPAYHDRATPTGEDFYQTHGLLGIEVNDEVFESEASAVFEQAENRMHTIKALLVATLYKDAFSLLN